MAEWVISAEWVILVGWAVGVTEVLEATVGSVALEASQGSDIRVSAGTVCRSTEGSVGRSWPEWAWVWGLDLDMGHLATPMAGMDTVGTVTRTAGTADMAPHSVVMATGVTATPATKCAFIHSREHLSTLGSCVSCRGSMLLAGLQPGASLLRTAGRISRPLGIVKLF